MSEIIITKFDYELGEDKQRWSAYIAGNSVEECTKFLMKTVPTAQIQQRSSGFRLDAMTEEVRNRFAQPYIKTINELKEKVEMLEIDNKKLQKTIKDIHDVKYAEKSVNIDEKNIKDDSNKKKKGRPKKK